MGKESKRADAIVDRDDDEPLGRKVRAYIHGDVAGAGTEAATVDVHEHRTSIGRLRRGPHVQVEAVLAHRTAKQELEGPRAERGRSRLHARRRELVRGTHT